MRVQGWWRTLPKTERDAIARQFWEVGRLTLEYWLTPRLASRTVHRWPGTEMVHAEATAAGGELQVRLSNGEGLPVDHVIFACGYRADLPRVPYLAGVLDRIQVSDGLPVLDEAFGTSLPGLYLPGFTATDTSAPSSASSKATPAAAVTSMSSTGTAKAVAAIWHDRARGRGGPGLRLDRAVGRAVVVHPGLPALLPLRTIE